MSDDTSRNLCEGSRPDSNQSTSSGNTGESLTTYADHTFLVLASMDHCLDISFLPAPKDVFRLEGDTIEPPKTSESLPLEQERTEPSQIDGQLQGTSGETGNKSGLSDKNKDYFATDASEVEELFHGMGSEGTHKRPTSSVTFSELLSAPEDEGGPEKSRAEQELTMPEVKEPKLPEQFSANGQAVLRKQNLIQLHFPKDILLFHSVSLRFAPSLRPSLMKL